VLSASMRTARRGERDSEGIDISRQKDVASAAI